MTDAGGNPPKHMEAQGFVSKNQPREKPDRKSPPTEVNGMRYFHTSTCRLLTRSSLYRPEQRAIEGTNAVFECFAASPEPCEN
jgi:hypothetical protein